MTTSNLLALDGQEMISSYKKMLLSEVSSFNKELSRRARIQPPLLPNTDLTEDEWKEVQTQVRLLFE